MIGIEPVSPDGTYPGSLRACVPSGAMAGFVARPEAGPPIELVLAGRRRDGKAGRTRPKGPETEGPARMTDLGDANSAVPLAFHERQDAVFTGGRR